MIFFYDEIITIGKLTSLQIVNLISLSFSTNIYWDNKWKYIEHYRHESSLLVWRRRKLPNKIIINSDICHSEGKTNGRDGE